MRTESLLMRIANNRIFSIFFVISIIYLIGLTSCENNPDELGRELLPDSLYVYFDTTEVINSFSIPGDSLVTNNKYKHLLGQRTDPQFGITTASFISQIGLFTEKDTHDFGTNPVADSVFLEINFLEYVGDPASVIEVELFEYMEDIPTDTNLYSNMDVTGKYNPALLGKGNINFIDSTLKIYITNQDFIERIFQVNDTILTENDYLTDFIKGLYFVPADISGEGAIISFDLEYYYERLIFHYKNEEEDSLSYYFIMGEKAGVTSYGIKIIEFNSRKINLFNHNYSGFPVEQHIATGRSTDSLIYIQSMGGVYAIIRFPNLEERLPSMPLAINQARLVLTPADTVFSGIKQKDYPEKLNLFLAYPNGEYRYVYDYLLNQNEFGGGYDEDKNNYTFNIKVQLQSYLRGDIENLDYILMPQYNTEQFTRMIFHGSDHSGNGRLKLEIIYTLL